MAGSTNFPTSLDSHTGASPLGFGEVVNQAYTLSTAAHTNSVTTLTVASTSAFPSKGYVIVKREIISYTGKTSTTFTGCTRATGGTTAAAFGSGTLVEQVPVAANHNDLAAAIVAVEAYVHRMARKNVLINGDMRVSQRATFETFPPAADNTYTAVDRWKTLMSAHFYPYPSTAYAPTAGNGSAYALGAVSGGTGSKWGYIQILEAADVYALRGQSVSVQAKIKATTGLSDIRMALVAWSGTADACTADPISTWEATGTNPTLIASWAHVNTPANLGVLTAYATYKVENLTVPTNATNLGVMVWNNDTTHTYSSDFFFFTDVQLELGAVCTEFERRSYAEELVMCQRYYFKTFPDDTTPAQNSSVYTGAVHYISCVGGSFITGQQLRYPQVMRTTPTVTYYNPGAANNKWRNATVGADSGTPSALRAGQKAIIIVNNQVAGDTVSNEICVHVTADAEL